MNLYFRMLVVFVKIWLGLTKRWSEESVLQFRVFPFDCDVNLHLTSSRYVAFADLGRIHLLGQIGILRGVLNRRWFPFASGVEITYIRPIMPLQKLNLRTRILTWDEKYWYTEHKFEVGNQLRAIAIVRGVFVKGPDIIPMNEIAALTDEDPASPPAPNSIQQWIQLLEAKKEEYSVKGTGADD